MHAETLPERKVPIIAIEGVDACGKGTQSYRLSQMLTEKHLLSSIVTSVVPDGLGHISYLRKFLVGGQPVSRISELLVYLASIYEVCSDIQKEEVDLQSWIVRSSPLSLISLLGESLPRSPLESIDFSWTSTDMKSSPMSLSLTMSS